MTSERPTHTKLWVSKIKWRKKRFYDGMENGRMWESRVPRMKAHCR